MRKLNKRQLEAIAKASFGKCSDIGLKHARENLPYIRQSIVDLKKEYYGINSAIIVSAGPSLHIKNSAKRIYEAKYKGTIISADGAMYYCLRNGVIPDFVVTVDPHPTRMIRVFGDPELRKVSNDDYFRRQDLEPTLNNDELRRNRQIIRLVDKYAKRMKLIVSTSVSPRVVKRCLEAGMRLYWWNPIYDDYSRNDSLTRKIYNLTKIPCMSTGGNVGTSAWVFANIILGAQNTGLVGMDLSYHPDTPLYKTQYYYEMKELFKDNLEDGYIRVYNPYLRQTWYTDPAYFWYRENFLNLAKQVKGLTYNCSEGGILFGTGIKFVKLEKFLKKFNRYGKSTFY